MPSSLCEYDFYRQGGNLNGRFLTAWRNRCTAVTVVASAYSNWRPSHCSTFRFSPILLSRQLFSLFPSILLLSAFLCPQVPIGGLFISCIPFHFSLQTLRPQLSAHFTLHAIHQPGTRSHMTPMLTYMSLSWETPRSRVECPALSVSTIFIDRGVTSTVAS